MTTFETLAGPIPVAPGDTVVLLDPQGLDGPAGPGEVAVATTAWELRRAIEQRVRRRPVDAPPLLVHAQIPGVQSAGDLAWDIAALPVVALNPSLPRELAVELTALPPAVARALTSAGSLDARLSAAGRIMSDGPWPPSPAAAVPAVLRILKHATPSLRAALAATCPAGIARDILAADDPADVIQLAVTGGTGAPDLQHAYEELSALADIGYIALPTAQSPATTRASSEHLVNAVEALLHGTQAADLPAWREVAMKWAEVRSLLSQADIGDTTAANLAATAWEWWENVDDRWVEWLVSSYGREVSRTTLTSVHGITRFLDGEVSRTGARVLLLVLDGLALSQWHYLQQLGDFSPIEEHVLLAGLPTITSVSRQSVLSGLLPVQFADTLDRTDIEEAGWRRFWLDAGREPDEIWYHRTPGRTRDDWEDPPANAVVCTAVVNAVDDLMHGSSVNGDHQLTASLRTWHSGGLLRAARDWATRHSAHLWVTSDHGNVPAKGLNTTVPNEGLASTRGKRSRRFASDALRDASALPGRRWSPPTYPKSAGSLLFAPGRSAYMRGGIAVTHGSLSMDEVFVPFARLT